MAPAKQESKNLRLGDEDKFVSALKEKKIIYSQVEQLKETLRMVMLKIGIRAHNMPAEEEKQVLIDHIITNFSNHTCAEIKLAFDMAIAGKLDVEVKAYENFSCLYFSNIMNAYREWSRETHKLVVKPIPQLQAAKIIDDPMTDEEFIEMNFKTWNVLKNHGFISIKCYTILCKQKKIIIAQDEKDLMYAQTEFILKQRMFTDPNWHEELKKLLDAPDPDVWKTRVFNECKKRVVENYFKTLL